MRQVGGFWGAKVSRLEAGTYLPVVFTAGTARIPAVFSLVMLARPLSVYVAGMGETGGDEAGHSLDKTENALL